MTSAPRPTFGENAYRILALPGEAAWTEIQRAAHKLRGMEAWGAWSSPWDLPLLGPVRRDKPDVDAALARLENPVTRLVERLLWFHERDAESAVAYLTPSSIRDAIEGWSSTSLATARHDAAVVRLVAALTFDPDIADLAVWRRVLGDWRAALARDDYWIEVMRVEMEGGFPEPATLGDLRDLREAGAGHVAAVLLERGSENDGAAGSRARALLREELSPALYVALCGGPPPAPPKAPEATPDQDRPTWPPVIEDPRDRHAAQAHATPPEGPAAGTPPPTTPSAEEPPARTGSRPARKAMAAHLARLRAGGAAGRPDKPAMPPTERPAVPPGRAGEPPVPAAKPAATTEPADARPAASTTPEPPIPAPGRAPRGPRLRRRVLMGGVLAAGIAALALVAPWRRDPAEPIAATESGDPIRSTVTARIDAADEAIARLLVERTDNRNELDFLRNSIADYRALVRDYDWRIANGLPYDPAGYARVEGYLASDLAQYRAAGAENRSLADRYDALIRERARLVAQYNSRR